MANPPSNAAIATVFAAIQQTPAAQAVARRVEAEGVFSLPAVSDAALAFFAALLQKLFPARPIVVVTSGTKEQERVHQDLETWLAAESGGRKPLFHPAWDTLPHEAKLPHSDVISERLETLAALAHHAPGDTPHAPVIVTTFAALMQKTFPPEEVAARLRTLKRGDVMNPLDLVEWLEEQGYEPEAKATQKGELSLRGGILDLFPPTSPWPVRLEFFGDDLESLRHFDPVSQISREEIAGIAIPPAGELGILKRAVAEGRAPKLATLPEHLPGNAIFVLCQPEALEEHAETYAQQIPDGDPFFLGWNDLVVLLASRNFVRIEVGQAEVARPAAALPDLESTGLEPPHIDSDLNRTDDLTLASLDAFRPLGERAPEVAIAEAQRREFFAQLHRWLRQGYAVHVFCNNDGERQRFEEIWSEMGFEKESGVNSQSSVAGTPQHVAEERQAPAIDCGLRTHLGTLSRGFLCDTAKLAVVTDAEIFGRYKVQRPRRLKSPHAVAVKSALDIDFTELAEGDYVVHLQHGIGRYRGLRFLQRGTGKDPNSGTSVEHLVIEYAPGDPTQEPPLLYVPVSEAHLISKYVGAGKARPQLNVLGGKRWQKTKEHAERAVRDLAAELLAIQAARETQAGHAFKADAPWQREFESAFIYEETPDQFKAIEETKRDMERPKPMDRLICGDVGFGKTEVAIRAAFKGVMDGRQVAILVPTTVLAQQHFNTFRERMADYPIRIELLSRFRTRREQERVIADLGAGAVDIVIGTHRLVQEDVHFKDLGLVIIDEEQRFGVMHKEKFKLLRKLVDVLTLSATPIPRTLYLALTGARDMSTIQTPPHDRLPVETVVTHYDERLIRDAIQRELNREGQVFFLHNRVGTIEVMRHKLRELVPHARVVVGHGQMHSDDLEEVMTKFVNGEADVLLSTTIIESGLDIPNANTIIIDRADRFGLSELYQLRGRVGRYKHQAFAYLLLPRHARLLTDVRKRMSALKQYSTLGSGFKIAMRDLEIRGAGNLLGAQQSGHITAVGFDLYCQLLKQSVSALKGEKVKPRVEVQVRLDFLSVGLDGMTGGESLACSQPPVANPADRGRLTTDSACIPLNYITEPQHRIEVYRRLAQADDKDAIESLRAELRDRFGPLPRAVDLLLLATELKCLASERAITVLETRDDKLMLTRHGDFVQIGGKFPRLSKKSAETKLKEIKKLLLAL